MLAFFYAPMCDLLSVRPALHVCQRELGTWVGELALPLLGLTSRMTWITDNNWIAFDVSMSPPSLKRANPAPVA